MVRINIIDPGSLADQHLIAEYNEILMLLGYVRMHPSCKNIPKKYCLGKGHILFFKNKLSYLKKRHTDIRKEMVKRGFKPKVAVDLRVFRKELKHDWKPCKDDARIIKERLISKINKKPRFYRYYGKKKCAPDLTALIRKARIK